MYLKHEKKHLNTIISFIIFEFWSFIFQISISSIPPNL